MNNHNYNNKFERKPVNYSQPQVPQKPVEIPEEFELPGDPIEENLEAIPKEFQENEISDLKAAKESQEVQDQLDPQAFPVKVKVAGCVSLNLRSTPDKSDNDNVISILKKDARLMVDHFECDWAYVSTPFGTEGYVLRSFIEEV